MISRRILTQIALASLVALSIFPAQAQKAKVEKKAAATSQTSEKATEPAIRGGGSRERFMMLHQSFLQRKKSGPIGVLFMGDSITERWTSAPAQWNKYCGEWNPASFGIGGDRTQNVIWRITEGGELDGISPKVMVLMIGTNNSNSDQPQDIVAAIEKIVKITREKLPDTKILLLAVFPRNSPKQMPENVPMKRIKEVNEKIAKLDDGKMVKFLDIGDKFLVNGTVPKDIMPDGLHPNQKGYEIWGEAIQPVLREMMTDKATKKE